MKSVGGLMRLVRGSCPGSGVAVKVAAPALGGDGSVVACTHPYAGVTQRDRYAHTISADDRVGRVIPEPVLPVVQELAGVPRLGLAFWPVGEGKCPCT